MLFPSRLAVLLFACAGLPHAQHAIAVLPDQYHLVFENEHVRVIHVRYGPHERLPVHKHPETPTIYVYLTDSGPVRFEHSATATLVRRPVKAGTFRVSPGLLGETHGVANLGEIPSEFLRVELKQLPLGIGSLHHRSAKPLDLTTAGRTREFRHPRLVIDRVVGPAGGNAAAMAPSAHGSLLVALSPVQVTRPAGLPGKRLDLGGAIWVVAGEWPTITASGDAPAHVLRIELRDGR